MFELEDFANFQVQVTATEMTDTQFTYNAGEQFSDYECIEITQDGKCVNFLVEPLGVEQEGTWISYELEIHWNKILGQELDPALVRILHDIGPNGDGIYDEDMCETALSDDAYLDCEIDPDPGVRSGDTDFQNFTAALASTPLNVPEPSTLTLLAAGVGGILCRRRRRSVKSDVTPRA